MRNTDLDDLSWRLRDSTSNTKSLEYYLSLHPSKVRIHKKVLLLQPKLWAESSRHVSRYLFGITPNKPNWIIGTLDFRTWCTFYLYYSTLRLYCWFFSVPNTVGVTTCRPELCVTPPGFDRGDPESEGRVGEPRKQRRRYFVS